VIVFTHTVKDASFYDNYELKLSNDRRSAFVHLPIDL
jgi:hypothetical protein